MKREEQPVDEKEIIIQKAGELAVLLQKHPVTIEYARKLEEMKGDSRSRELYDLLVAIGRELHGKYRKGESPRLEDTEQNRLLEEELRENRLVREFISAQKEYLNLVSRIRELIQNPEMPAVE